MYADLQKIEDRGKRKKKGFATWFGKKDKEQSEKESVESFADLKPESHTPEEPEEKWVPLNGRKKKRAVELLLDFKTKLNKAFKEGRLTKEQCRKRTKIREIELSLRSPEE